MFKPLRFFWRASRNALCVFPWSRGLLFRQDHLAKKFGRNDAEYAWRVFQHHFNLLQSTDFKSAARILEIGPGSNLGTSLLWWVFISARSGMDVKIVCWDVFKNASPEEDGYWINLADDLLASVPDGFQNSETETIVYGLTKIKTGNLQPHISYRVESLSNLEYEMNSIGVKFDLIFSQAAIEHVWEINILWEAMVRLTAENGWHSHRIDLADHGRRNSNYIEMLEWSDLGYWLTMRFVPGAINRWRAVHHLSYLENLGITIVLAQKEMREHLPIALNRLASEFRNLSEEDLRTTALNVVGENTQRKN